MKVIFEDCHNRQKIYNRHFTKYIIGKCVYSLVDSRTKFTKKRKFEAIQKFEQM